MNYSNYIKYKLSISYENKLDQYVSWLFFLVLNRFFTCTFFDVPCGSLRSTKTALSNFKSPDKTS